MAAPSKRKRTGRPRSPKWCCPLCYESTFYVGPRYKCSNCDTAILPIVMTAQYIDKVFDVARVLNGLPRSPLAEYIRSSWFQRERHGKRERYYRRNFTALNLL